jgi:urea carboxylase-associated protein 1
MPQFDDIELTAAVINSFKETQNPRLKFLMEELVRSLHEYVKRTDLSFAEWQQAIDFLCYSAELPLDRINLPNTVKLNKSLYITKGSKIYSDLAREMMTVVEDTCGYHDTLAGCCSCEIDKVRYGVIKIESCRTNFIAELAKWAMSPSEIVSNINFFMRVPFTADGDIRIAEGVSKAGDYVVLRAEMPVLVVISNCPQQHNPAAGFAPTPVEVVVTDAPAGN